MTIRDFWASLIKIMGLWFILSCLSSFSGYFSIAFFYFQTGELSGLVRGILGLLIVGLFYWLILRLLFFRTDWIIDQLKLDQGYQEEKMNLDGQQIPAMVNIAMIVTGGVLLANTIPTLFKECFVFFQQETIFREHPSSGMLILLMVKVVIGYLLITNSNTIVKYALRNSSGK